jgi:DeoR family transcriptional regulator of aga operon
MASAMSIAERHKYILEKLRREGYIRVTDISDELGITAVTVRKDFQTLENQGLLFRTHGSASPVNPHVGDRSVFQKEQENKEQKQAIGRAAAALVKADDSIMIASGSTVAAFVGALRPVDPLNVVTPSLRVALELNENDNITVIQLGGIIYKKSLSVRSGIQFSQFGQFSCSKLFIGVDGINEEYGVTTSNLEEAMLTQNMMAVCTRTIVLADSSKFTKRGFGKICGLEQIDTLVTDGGISSSQIKLLENYGINVIIAD